MWHFPVAIPSSLGPWAVFASVLITQLGMPVPAVPMLILGGTMAAMGQASYGSMFCAAVGATMIADSLWFFMGRTRGRRLINGLVRFSLSLDTTVRIARNVFERHGAPLLVLAKFLPGLGLVSAPPLRFERLANSEFEGCKYYCFAPLKTEDHLELLTQFERAAT